MHIYANVFICIQTSTHANIHEYTYTHKHIFISIYLYTIHTHKVIISKFYKKNRNADN